MTDPRRGFVVENEWYWRISENAKTFDAAAALRDFLAPLARVSKDSIAITDLVATGNEVHCTIGEQPVAIAIDVGAHDRVAINHFVIEVNRVLAASKLAFAIVTPKRYELRGVLLSDAELAELAGTPELMIPSGRPSLDPRAVDQRDHGRLPNRSFAPRSSALNVPSRYGYHHTSRPNATRS